MIRLLEKLVDGGGWVGVGVVFAEIKDWLEPINKDSFKVKSQSVRG